MELDEIYNIDCIDDALFQDCESINGFDGGGTVTVWDYVDHYLTNFSADMPENIDHENIDKYWD